MTYKYEEKAFLTLIILLLLYAHTHTLQTSLLLYKIQVEFACSKKEKVDKKGYRVSSFVGSSNIVPQVLGSTPVLFYYSHVCVCV